MLFFDIPRPLVYFCHQRMLDERDQQVMALSTALTERNDELAVLRAARAVRSTSGTVRLEAAMGFAKATERAAVVRSTHSLVPQ